MKMKKHTLITLSCSAALLALCAGAPLVSAYLTDRDSTSNLVTIGSVKTELIEPAWPGNDSDDVQDIVPNQEIDKDPQLVNTGKNDSLCFMKIEVPVAYLVTAQDDGTRSAAAYTEVFSLLGDRDADPADGINDEWELLGLTYLDADGNETSLTPADGEGAPVKAVRIAGYTSRTSPQETTSSVFDRIRLVNLVEGQLEETEQSVVLTGMVIQADYIADVDTSADRLSKSVLEQVCSVYFNQNASAE